MDVIGKSSSRIIKQGAKHVQIGITVYEKERQKVCPPKLQLPSPSSLFAQTNSYHQSRPSSPSPTGLINFNFSFLHYSALLTNTPPSLTPSLMHSPIPLLHRHLSRHCTHRHNILHPAILHLLTVHARRRLRIEYTRARLVASLHVHIFYVEGVHVAGDKGEERQADVDE